MDYSEYEIRWNVAESYELLYTVDDLVVATYNHMPTLQELLDSAEEHSGQF